jgi:hypothetical protein
MPFGAVFASELIIISPSTYNSLFSFFMKIVLRTIPSRLHVRSRVVSVYALCSFIALTLFLAPRNVWAQLGINAASHSTVHLQKQTATTAANDTAWFFRPQVCNDPVLDSVRIFLFVPTPSGGRRPISGRVDSVRILNVPPTSNFRILSPLSPTNVTAGVNSALIVASFSSTRLGVSTATLRTYSVDSVGAPIVQDFTIYTLRERRSFQVVTQSYNFGTLPPNTPASVTIPFIRNTGTVPLDWEIANNFGNFQVTSVRPAPIRNVPGISRVVLLQPGDTAFITVQFPGAAAGQTVTYNAVPIDRTCNERGAEFNLIASTIQNPPNITVTPSTTALRPIYFGQFDCPTQNAPFKDTTLRVYNSGQADLQITGVSFSLPDYQLISPTMLSTTSPLVVPFNQTRELIIRYNPRFSDPRDRFATMSISSNSPTGVTTVTLTAEKDSINLTVSTREIDFGSIQRDSPAPTRTMTITNNGTTAQPWLPPFNLGNGFVVESVTPNPTLPGATAQATVRFTNTATAGQFSALWNITDLCQTRIPITMRINVDKPRPGIGVSSPVTFGQLTCSSDTTLSVTIRNTSNDGQELIISDLSILGGASSPFLLLSPPVLPLTVRSGMPQTLQIRYRPQRTGNATDTLRFTSNADDFPIFNVVLQGAKDSVGFSISRTNISFVNILPNFSATDTLTIRNNGTTPIAWGSTGRFNVSGAFTMSFSPQVTPPNGTTLVTVRFLGSAVDASGTGSFSDACGRTQMFSVQASILPPRIAVTSDVSFFTLECETSSRATVTVQNTGGQDLLITSITGAAQGISIDAAPSNSAPIRLSAGRDTTLTVRFQPTMLGQSNALFRYLSNAVNRDAMGSTSTTLSGVKNARDFVWLDAVEPVFVTFGSVPPNAPVTRTLTLRNTGNLPIAWGNIPLRFGQDTVFSVESISPNPTMPGATAQVTMRYRGAACGTTYLTSQFSRLLSNFGTMCDKNSNIGAFAETLPATARLRLESISGGIGDVVQMPIRIENATFLREAGVREFTANLRFNKTIMFPVSGTALGTVNATDRIIPVRLPLPSPFPTDSVLARLSFRITLGNTTNAQVFIDNPSAGGICINLDTASARTSARRICFAGGERLVEIITTATALAIAKPNPVQTLSQMDVTLTERGFTTLAIYNTMGQAVKQVWAESKEPGEYAVLLDASELPSGLYFCILQTPTERITQRVEVIR